MPYLFATERPNYADLASGQVFYSQPGQPAFPARLASEIFQRCLAIRAAMGIATPCVIYDPCCGGAYLLSVLAYLHWESIHRLVGSDADENAVRLARRNLDLLTLEGLDKRIAEIAEMLERYGKESHRAALLSARALRDRIASANSTHAIQTKTFRANALDGNEVTVGIQGVPIDIVFTDVPYGQHSQWVENKDNPVRATPLELLLSEVWNVLAQTSLLVVVADKSQKISHASYKRVEQFQIGKRRVAILQPLY